MKTTIEVSDALLARAKRHAQRTGRPLRALVEDGLRLVLSREAEIPEYELPDCAAGDPCDPNPLESLSWAELRDEIYGGR